MPANRLSALQQRVLRVLGNAVPGWRLAGGGALVGFYLGHRTTRDLDLFWMRRAELGDLPARVTEVLRHEELEVTSLETALTFHRLRVSVGGEATIVDLVSDPMPEANPALTFRVGDVTVAVEPIHDILVSKLCALLGRAEIRDLIDVEALLASGQDLRAAVAAAPKRDGGFSTLTLAWLLEGLNVGALARAADLADDDAGRLTEFAADLKQRLLELGKPE